MSQLHGVIIIITTKNVISQELLQKNQQFIFPAVSYWFKLMTRG
jgi:hypothetical protein